MRKIFITYADQKFELSKKQLLKEAKSLGLFDAVIGYSPDDLPPFIQASPLMAYSRGGGYWVWKPWIIWKTMQDFPDAIVVYVDAGCTLHNTPQWQEWFDMMETTDTLVTAYRKDFDYGWETSFHTNSVAIGDWTKKNTLEYFDKLFGNADWHQKNKIWGGAIITKRESPLIKMWLDITLFYPYLVIDPIGDEEVQQNENYIQHRHDQSILTPLAYWFEEQTNEVLIIPETGESNPQAAIVASRRIITKSSIWCRLKRFIKRILLWRH